ncbi:Predicted ATPase [Tessaracoccus bendigoensis DSM 12906]|uniref:Predicted ATPase n=1 Tax=Tessaracoccus bendigoensis DSM 12906 TaxID=1123357 RepID=A0A1M6ITB2_9ACTN|nr:AAA family ATPase [Tessaracoccus bendigoensis]SHJ37655.1 Predicted ATPase [Tessaracoccus bendigoensis DSM 12906]
MQIDSFRIQNYRVLQDVSFQKLTQLTVLVGANGSGKSTVFDAFAFLHEAFTTGLRGAWDRRNRMAAIISRGSDGPVHFELKYTVPVDGREKQTTYSLAISEQGGAPVVEREVLRWTTAPGSGRPREILRFENGVGRVYDEATESSQEETLSSPDLLAVSALGQMQRHVRVRALREFIQGWYLSYLSAANTRGTPTSGPESRLNQSGDNLANVLQYLEERHPETLQEVFDALGSRVPQLESIRPTRLEDGRLLLRLKDRSFEDPVLATYTSDGTLKLLAYLTLLHDPNPPTVIGIEEPENQLHPALVPRLAEDIRALSTRSQVFVTTHSREFLEAIQAKELWTIGRGEDGYARVQRVSDDPRVKAMLNEGATLSELWSEGYLAGANPPGM